MFCHSTWCYSTNGNSYKLQASYECVTDFYEERKALEIWHLHLCSNPRYIFYNFRLYIYKRLWVLVTQTFNLYFLFKIHISYSYHANSIYLKTNAMAFFASAVITIFACVLLSRSLKMKMGKLQNIEVCVHIKILHNK